MFLQHINETTENRGKNTKAAPSGKTAKIGEVYINKREIASKNITYKITPHDVARTNTGCM